MTPFEIRQATSDDADAVVGLWQEAQRWLAASGTDQWQPRPGDTAAGLLARVRASTASAIDQGHCFVAMTDQGDVAGAITVDGRADPEFWTADDQPDAALYVHRMIVARRYAGLGLGAKLLEFAADHAKQNGRSLLRLDAWQTNEALHRYYESQGFRLVRRLRFEHRGSGALFERPV